MAMEAMNGVTTEKEVQAQVSKAVGNGGKKPVQEKPVATEAEVKGRQGVAQSTVRDTIKKTNDMMTNTRCEFSYHEKTHRVSIKVVNKDTDEVIREIPPEESLEMLEKMWEMAGILVDEKR